MYQSTLYAGIAGVIAANLKAIENHNKCTTFLTDGTDFSDTHTYYFSYVIWWIQLTVGIICITFFIAHSKIESKNNHDHDHSNDDNGLHQNQTSCKKRSHYLLLVCFASSIFFSFHQQGYHVTDSDSENQTCSCIDNNQFTILWFLWYLIFILLVLTVISHLLKRLQRCHCTICTCCQSLYNCCKRYNIGSKICRFVWICVTVVYPIIVIILRLTSMIFMTATYSYYFLTVENFLFD